MANRNRLPDHFTTKENAPRVRNLQSCQTSPDCIRIALVNNMPDSALRDTESQFFELLAAAAGDLPVHIGLYFLPEIPRSEQGQRHVASFYRPIDELWSDRVDAIIVTGTEPHQPNLRQEPYWNHLTSLFDWAESNTKSAVLSCLAAHASVLHFDGIERRRLQEKKCGVFEQSLAHPHSLTDKISGAVTFPQSRWNEVREGDLASCGYLVLTRSSEGGADLFVKKRKRSLFVYFQGHPEYGTDTLFKEYRRDVSRYLRGKRDTYPLMPCGYFDAASTRLLSDFQVRAASKKTNGNLPKFPEPAVVNFLSRTWQSAAVGIYHNWLQYLVVRRAEESDGAGDVGVGKESRAYRSNESPGPLSVDSSSTITAQNARTSHR